MPIVIRRFKVGSAQIENDAIGSQHIANDAISYAAQIKDGILGYAELTTGLQGSVDAGSVPPANSIGTTELKEPSVGSSQLYDDAVGTSSKIGADVIMGYHITDDAIGSEHLEANAVGSSAQVGDDTIGSAQIINNTVGYGELTSGLQGSFAGVPERPYAGDDSEVSVTGTTPGTVKTATILKNSYMNDIGSIKIAAQLKASAGSYIMEVLLGTVHKFDMQGTETVYTIKTGSIGVGGESDGALALEFTLRNSQAAAIAYNKLLDIITVV